MTVIAVSARNLRELLDVLPEVRAGNRRVLLVGSNEASADLGTAQMLLILGVSNSSAHESEGDGDEDDESVFSHGRLRCDTVAEAGGWG